MAAALVMYNLCCYLALLVIEYFQTRQLFRPLHFHRIIGITGSRWSSTSPEVLTPVTQLTEEEQMMKDTG